MTEDGEDRSCSQHLIIGVEALSQIAPTLQSTHPLLWRGQGAWTDLPFVVLLLWLLCQWATGAEAETAGHEG